MTVDKMRSQLSMAYPNSTWKNRVRVMPDEQVTAVYFRIKRDEPWRLPHPKRNDDYPIYITEDYEQESWDEQKEEVITLNCKTEVVMVSFQGSFGYQFMADKSLELKKGDLVVCDTSKGVTIGNVIEVDVQGTKATKWVIDKVNMERHTQRLETQKRINSINAKLKEKRKTLEERVIYDMLARDNKEIADMLAELDELKNK